MRLHPGHPMKKRLFPCFPFKNIPILCWIQLGLCFMVSEHLRFTSMWWWWGTEVGPFLIPLPWGSCEISVSEQQPIQRKTYNVAFFFFHLAWHNEQKLTFGFVGGGRTLCLVVQRLAVMGNCWIDTCWQLTLTEFLVQLFCWAPWETRLSLTDPFTSTHIRWQSRLSCILLNRSKQYKDWFAWSFPLTSSMWSWSSKCQ